MCRDLRVKLHLKMHNLRIYSRQHVNSFPNSSYHIFWSWFCKYYHVIWKNLKKKEWFAGNSEII